MRFAREKRLLLGLLALLAPVPLPLNQALEWPVLGVYLAAVALFLRRAWLGRPRWLPFWGMNVLGLLYLPIFVLDLLWLGSGGLVRPVVHLALFTVAVKLFSLTRERDKWQALMGTFFLFLVGMATSVHPSVVLYLLVFLLLSLLLLARFAFLHLMAGFGGAASAPVPFKGVLALAAAASLLIAVPLFALLPRVHAPYIVGRGFSSGPSEEITGFSDEVTLDSIGLVRTSREVALRLQFDGGVTEELLAERDGMRFKGGTFDTYKGNRWVRSPHLEVLPNSGLRRRALDLAPVPAARWATLWLQPLASRSLVLPIETAKIELSMTPYLNLNRGGALSLVFRPQEVISYRVALAERFVGLAAAPESEREGTLDLSGVTDRMKELAGRVMGEGADRDRVERLQDHLMSQYEYTLDFVGRAGEDPLEDFLFRYRSGHCEYFATAMVLMLRSQGVPARLATGFLGAEHNPLEGYFIVRQGNAHVWVEAWLADEGRWELFDPTPMAGRPTGGGGSLWSLAVQGWDYVLFRWDRHVLSYDFEDQLRFFVGLREAWGGLWKVLFRGEGEGERWSPSEEVLPAEEAAAEQPEVARRTPAAAVAVPVVLLVALLPAALLLARRLRRPLTVEGAYRRLRLELERGGFSVSPIDPPLALRRSTLARYPRAADPAGRVFDLYLQESFAGQPLDEEERSDLHRSLREAIRGMRRSERSGGR